MREAGESPLGWRLNIRCLAQHLLHKELLLTIPHSWAQAGLPSAIVVQFVHLCIGWWSGYTTNLLYLEYKKVAQKRDPHRFDNHTIQLHEVLGGLMGKWWERVSLFFNIGTLGTIATVEILASSNIVFYMNDSLDKRTWALIFGGIFSLSVFTPSAQNYRAWSFLGVIATIYTAFYLIIAGIVHKEIPDVNRPFSPREFSEYFIPMTNFIALGTEAIPVEIMDAMWKPEEYKLPWLFGMVYTGLVSLIPTMSLFWRFGDKLLKQANAIALLPKSIFRDAAVILLLLHQARALENPPLSWNVCEQFVVFGMFTLPIYLIFEKLFNVHNSPSFGKRILVRVPVFLVIWVAALAFPFFGLSTPISVALFATWGQYILPCSAYIFTFWKRASEASIVDKHFSLLRWETILSINLGIVLWMLFMSGFGLWANIVAIANQVHQVGLFTKCYNCKRG
ncbi:auxin transporter-like protein 2 isoform X2 [Selaginella moellendorffii]|uniref:auxin transporter-like protein 2 isoform X2 n=1 Tax=Selaginella moellendorffii TaxID=88036 RepID=UPI000D1CA5EF|nr:auxin transporter-like protein 2 isoform X2 [Selaginella moellendorffii]|eukprot:XP_024536360.1 auxin transporter-like protein 2 isoform X2 [Selaginella moellendorffii]